VLRRPVWDSGVGDAPLQTARDEGCEFPGLGAHPVWRGKVTWWQEVGGSAIVTQKIGGHSSLGMANECRLVAIQRYEELTRALQDTLDSARKKKEEENTAKHPAPI